MRDIESDLVQISEGPFIMGACEEKEEDAEYNEQPEREVWLSTYHIQKIPVTIAQWKIFLEDTNYEWMHHKMVAKRCPSENHPIVHVNWFDACQFAKWLSEKLEASYNLPTEAQWEKACRGQHGCLYPWGNSEKEWEEEFPAYLITNLPVGSRPENPTPFGCLDMWENVSEWCLDWFDYGDYVHDPKVIWTNPTGPKLGDRKVYRGGNPLTSGWPRCTYRGVLKPDDHYDTVGFRLVKAD